MGLMSTIHHLKNYFATVFSEISFYFSTISGIQTDHYLGFFIFKLPYYLTLNNKEVNEIELLM